MVECAFLALSAGLRESSDMDTSLPSNTVPAVRRIRGSYTTFIHAGGTLMESAIWGFLGAIIGATLTAFVALFNSHRQRRAEIDARVLSAAFGYATVEWRGHIDAPFKGGSGRVFPLVCYLFHAIEIARAANKGPLTIAELQRVDQATKDLLRDFCKLGLGNNRLEVEE
jgi:hypothetical protein